MSAPSFTPGPWQWEFNRAHKSMSLVGGRPKYDLTIMDFDRWGMRGAVATLRDTAEDGMNIMHRLCDRPDWIAPFPGRNHHADWCADVIHPDMRLMAAAPDLLEALQLFVAWSEAERNHEGTTFWGRVDMLTALDASARAAIAKATGAQP